MNKGMVKYSYFVLSAGLVAYLATCFIQLEFNPLEWQQAARVVFSIVTMVLPTWIFLVMYGQGEFK